MRNKTNGQFVVTHGRTKTKEHSIWCGMKERCLNPNNKRWPYYGGRGITICDEWKFDFPRFLADMGECPEGKTLERKDNSKGYAPDNCIWATHTEQCNNRRTSRLITYGGKTQTMRMWAREAGVVYGTLFARLKAGWTMARALSREDARRSAWCGEPCKCLVRLEEL